MVPVGAREPAALSAVLPALLAAQVDLGGDLSTGTLARSVGLSASRFHELFTAAVGETVKQHTLRLRLERSAFRLRTEATAVSAIAFDLGFGSHEAFTRAFHDRFGCSPSVYRSGPTPARASAPAHRSPGDRGLQESVDQPFLSRTRVVQLRATTVAFRRFVGPYEQVSPAAFEDLEDWARRHGLPAHDRIGISHDAPGITPDHRLRFDVCVTVPGRGRGDATTAFRSLPLRWASSTWYSGPVAQLGAAVAAAFRASTALAGYSVLGLPLEEHYTSSHYTSSHDTSSHYTSSMASIGSIDWVRILLPLERVTRL